MRPAPKRSCVGHRLRGMLKTSLMQRRRETVYRMLLKRHGSVPCFVCGKHVQQKHATLEHMKPLSKGGTDDMSNLAISHGPCNSRRGSDDLAKSP